MFEIKKYFNFVKSMLSALIKLSDKFRMCYLCLVYGYKYDIFNETTHRPFKILLSLIVKKTSEVTIKNICEVKPSKIIFEKDNKELIILDRTIPNFYFDIRDKFSHFHETPIYTKVDKKSYWQKKANSNINIFSLDKSDLFDLFANYFTNQLELKKACGIEVPVSKFIAASQSFIVSHGKMNSSTGVFNERINLMSKKNESLILVPSVIEPWPLIKDNFMVFCDLSPVEFRNAPFLHDLLYILFKYELYGSRQKNHSSVFPVIFDALKKIANGHEENIEGKELVNLVKLIHSIVKPEEFVDAYIMMIVFHSYVKYEATGKFINSSAKRRFELAINRHAKIFKLVIC